MQEITFDPFLLEIARTIDENNIRKRVELAHFSSEAEVDRHLSCAETSGLCPGSFLRRWHPLVSDGKSYRRDGARRLWAQ